MSDLHLEFLKPDARAAWLQALDPDGVDVLILAGDIATAGLLGEVLPAFAELYPAVVFVTGNHEYYGSSPAEVHEILKGIAAEHSNFHWLDNEVKEVAGLKFVGGTLWFPKPESPEVYQARFGMNDFRIIRDFEPWVYEQNRLCEEVLVEHAASADVVVTHHIPTSSCVAPEFRVGPSAMLNHFFCRDLTPQIEKWQPPLWVFGHTHHRMWTFIKSTKLVCNSLGYPHEPESRARGKFIKKCLLEITERHKWSHQDVVDGTSRRMVISKTRLPGPGLPGTR